jgi:hypothetical protein
MRPAAAAARLVSPAQDLMEPLIAIVVARLFHVPFGWGRSVTVEVADVTLNLVRPAT